MLGVGRCSRCGGRGGGDLVQAQADGVERQPATRREDLERRRRPSGKLSRIGGRGVKAKLPLAPAETSMIFSRT